MEVWLAALATVLELSEFHRVQQVGYQQASAPSVCGLVTESDQYLALNQFAGLPVVYACYLFDKPGVHHPQNQLTHKVRIRYDTTHNI